MPSSPLRTLAVRVAPVGRPTDRGDEPAITPPEAEPPGPGARARRVGATVAATAVGGLALAMFLAASSSETDAGSGTLQGAVGTFTVALEDDALFPLPVDDPDAAGWDDLEGAASAAVVGQLLLDGSANPTPTTVTLASASAADRDGDGDATPDWASETANGHVAPEYRQADWLLTAVCAEGTATPGPDSCALVRWADPAPVELASLPPRGVVALPTWTWLVDTGRPQAQRVVTEVELSLRTTTRSVGPADGPAAADVTVAAYGTGEDGLTPAHHLHWSAVPGATSYRVQRDGTTVTTTTALDHVAVLQPHDVGTRPSWVVVPVAADGTELPALRAPATTARHALWDGVADRPLGGAEALRGLIAWRDDDGDGLADLVVPPATALRLTVPSTSIPRGLELDATAVGRPVLVGRDDAWGTAMLTATDGRGTVRSGPAGSRVEALDQGPPWRWDATGASAASPAGDAADTVAIVPDGLGVTVPAGAREVVLRRAVVRTGTGTVALVLDGRHVDPALR